MVLVEGSMTGVVVTAKLPRMSEDATSACVIGAAPDGMRLVCQIGEELVPLGLAPRGSASASKAYKLPDWVAIYTTLCCFPSGKVPGKVFSVAELIKSG